MNPATTAPRINSRLTAAAYGRMAHVSASLHEEQAHWRAPAGLRPDPLESEDDRGCVS